MLLLRHKHTTDECMDCREPNFSLIRNHKGQNADQILIPVSKYLCCYIGQCLSKLEEEGWYSQKVYAEG
jgi:hypothetical protein